MGCRVSDFTDHIIDGLEMPVRGRYWKTKFQEEHRRVQQKNMTIAKLHSENKHLRAALKCGVSLMPLGTGKRAAWVTDAAAILSGEEQG